MCTRRSRWFLLKPLLLKWALSMLACACVCSDILLFVLEFFALLQ